MKRLMIGWLDECLWERSKCWLFLLGEYENDFGETCGLVLYEYDLDGDGDMDDTFIEDEYFCETF